MTVLGYLNFFLSAFLKVAFYGLYAALKPTQNNSEYS